MKNTVRKDSLLKITPYVVVDAYFSKVTFVDGAILYSMTFLLPAVCFFCSSESTGRGISLSVLS